MHCWKNHCRSLSQRRQSHQRFSTRLLGWSPPTSSGRSAYLSQQCNARAYSILPLCSFASKNITIDTGILHGLLKRLEPIPETLKEFQVNKRAHWESYFRLSKAEGLNKRRAFEFMVKTDGYAVSFILSEVKMVVAADAPVPAPDLHGKRHEEVSPSKLKRPHFPLVHFRVSVHPENRMIDSYGIDLGSWDDIKIKKSHPLSYVYPVTRCDLRTVWRMEITSASHLPSLLLSLSSHPPSSSLHLSASGSCAKYCLWYMDIGQLCRTSK